VNLTDKKIIVIKLKNQLQIISILFLFSLVACEKEDDKDLRDNFVGSWLVNENSSLLGQRTYEVTIFKDSTNYSDINIYNFYKIGKDHIVFSTISTTENNTLTIPLQNSKNNIINGSGKLKENLLEINYFINDGNTIDTVIANYTRDKN